MLWVGFHMLQSELRFTFSPTELEVTVAVINGDGPHACATIISLAVSAVPGRVQWAGPADGAMAQ